MISTKLGWAEVVHAARHDMFPVMPTSMEAAIASMEQVFDAEDMSEKSTERVITALHQKRPLSTMKIAAIRRLVEQTRIHKEEGERMSLVSLGDAVFDADFLSLSVCIVVDECGRCAVSVVSMSMHCPSTQSPCSLRWTLLRSRRSGRG